MGVNPGSPAAIWVINLDSYTLDYILVEKTLSAIYYDDYYYYN